MHFAGADSDEELVRRALELLAQPEAAREMGKAARRLVVETTSWPAMLASLPEILGQSYQPKAQLDAA